MGEVGSDLPVGREELRAELGRLRDRERELWRELAEIEHEGRRTADGLERAGGRADGLEERMALLQETRAEILRQREHTRRRIEQLERELGEGG